MGDRLKEKVALVRARVQVARAGGNGKVTAVLFAREGAKVLAVDIDLDAALETKQIVEQSAASVKQSRSTYRVPPTSPP